ncbi:hypothetical protein GCM10027344_01020 [Spelaeicoccus albus]
MAGAVGLLTGCSKTPSHEASSGASKAPDPTTSPPPSGLSALGSPVAFASIPVTGGDRQPAMVKLLKPDDFFAARPDPIWTFTGDDDWNSFNGFKFRTMGSRTVALLVGSRGHLAIVPVEPSDKAAVTTNDIIWQSSTQHTDNPHAAELVPAGKHAWPDGRGTAPDLFIVAAPGEGGSLAVYDIDADTAWRTPFAGGHGVLWDPTAKRLWALGNSSLSSYRIQKYAKTEQGAGEVDHTGSGWDLGDARHEIDTPLMGHDLQPDYNSHGTHLLITTPSQVFRVPKRHPGKRTSLTLPVGKPGVPSYKGSQKVKSLVRTSSGLYVWVRLQGHGFNPDAVWTDNAISVGKATDDGKIAQVATLKLPKGDWTYKARVFSTDYS